MTNNIRQRMVRKPAEFSAWMEQQGSLAVATEPAVEGEDGARQNEMTSMELMQLLIAAIHRGARGDDCELVDTYWNDKRPTLRATVRYRITGDVELFEVDQSGGTPRRLS